MKRAEGVIQNVTIIGLLFERGFLKNNMILNVQIIDEMFSLQV